MNGDYDAIVLAAAGVARLGLNEHIAEYLSFDAMLPAPGQAALAVQCRSGDSILLELLAAIEEPHARQAVTAERAFLASLGGGCSAPVAAYAAPALVAASSGGGLHLTGLVAAADGRRVVRVSGEDDDPLRLGADLARQALAQGAAELLQ
jgi:hydroxymethylbilane synthase